MKGMRDLPHVAHYSAVTGGISVIDRTKHDYETALGIVGQHSGRFGTMREFLIEGSTAEGFEKLRGGSYWMDGRFWKQIGYYRVDAARGIVAKLREDLWRALPRETRAVFTGGKGPGPAAIVIHDDGDGCEYRFEIIQSAIILAGIGIIGLPGLRRETA